MLNLIFYAFAALTLGGSLAVLLTRNVMYSAFFLLLSLLGVAALFVLASADLLAVAQVMIYVGGVLVLVIFGVMLTHKSKPEPNTVPQAARPNHILTQHRAWLWPLLVAAGLFTAFYSLLSRTHFSLFEKRAPFQTSVDTIGKQLMTEYIIPFEIAGILLLAALVGAAYLSSQNDRTNDRQPR